MYKFSFVQKNVMIHGETFGQHPFREARDTGKKSCPPPPSRFDEGIVEETGLNFFSGLELDFNQRTIFKLACASSNSRKTLRENNRSIFIYKKAINRKVKVKLNSPPSLLFSYPLATRVQLLQIHRTVHPRCTHLPTTVLDAAP